MDSKKNPVARYTIRGFRRSDFHRLWEIDQTCFARGISYSQFELLTYMRRSRAFTLVAERVPGDDAEAWAAVDGANTVGFIVAEAGRQTGHIITIDVLEEARRSGLGSRLLVAAEERLREWGCQAVVLETAVDNATALAFYKRHEYFLVRTERGYYATGVDAFVLRKELGSGEAKS